MANIRDDLSLGPKLRGSGVFGTGGDPGCPSGGAFGVTYLRDGERTSGGSGVAKTAG